MSYFFPHLNAGVRALMVLELNLNLASGRIPLPPRLRPQCFSAWVNLLREAFEAHDETWLALALRSRALLEKRERLWAEGEEVSARMPAEAPFQLAELEFNRHYTLAVCRMLLEEGGGLVEICRAREGNLGEEARNRLGMVVPAQEMKGFLDAHTLPSDLTLKRAS